MSQLLPIILKISDESLFNEWLSEYLIAQSIVHPQMYEIKPEKKEITIAQVRDIKKIVALTSKSPRVFILYDFDTAATEVQNALLKTIEEMNGANLYILVVKNSQSVLPTITSRCGYIDISQQIAVVIRPEVREAFEKLRAESSVAVIQLPVFTVADRETAVSLIDELIHLMRENAEVYTKYSSHIRTAMQLKQLIVVNNLNPQLAIDRFVLALVNS